MMPTRRWLAPLFVALLAACATVPGTGRSQLKLISLEDEINLGAEAYGQTLADVTLIEVGPDVEMVKRIGRRVSEAALRLYPDPADSFAWEIVLIDQPEMVNAWALPGGKSAVYTGLLPVTQDENSLAIVVGHEVAHAIAHHGAERMSHGMFFQLLLNLTAASLGDMSQAGQESVMQAIGAGVQVGAMLPFSRMHESEADELGLYLAAAAGYDPRASIGLWERMGASGGDRPPEFLSTHPSEGTRIEKLQAAMPRALEYYREALDNPVP